MAYNTNNPVPSSSPFDLFDNSENFDQGMNSTADTFRGRRGQNLYTWSFFHRMTANALAQINVTIGAAKTAVNSAADAAIDEMEETAAALGDDLNNKRYTSYSGVGGMLSDPQTRDAVVGIVDGDPNPLLDGWYSWSLESGSWVRFTDQPASSVAVKALEDDPQRPRAVNVGGTGEDLLVTFIDSLLRRTWLEARALDGGPSDWSVGLLRERLGAVLRSYPGMLYAVTDINGLLSDLCVRSSDGQVPEWVINRWAGRMAPILMDLLGLTPKTRESFLPDVRGSETVIGPYDTYTRDGEVLPMLPNMNQWAGWGSSTIAQFVEMNALAAEFGATYYNGGQSSESSTHTAARLGSVPAMLTVTSGSIPAAAGSVVAVTCSNVAPASYFRPTMGYLSGVRGQLKATDSAFTFVRDSAGQAVSVTGEIPFVPEDGPLHRADVTFLNMGKNEIQLGDAAEAVISRIDKSFDWMSPLAKRVMVIGQFSNVGTAAGSSSKLKLDQINSHCQRRYGMQFFDLSGYLTSSEIWNDTGITPTQADLDQQALGNIPPSLTLDNAAHMNSTARTAVAGKIKQLIEALRWYPS